MNRLRDYLPNLLDNKPLLINLIILLVLVFATSYSTSRFLLTYTARQEAQSQIASMQSYIRGFEESSSRINQASMRPVLPEQVDAVQTTILFNLQTSQLNMKNLRKGAEVKEGNGQIYEMEFTGPYVSVMQYLQHFQAKDALISIQEISMEQRNEMIHVNMKYKIYTK